MTSLIISNQLNKNKFAKKLSTVLAWLEKLYI
jgi:hypothetical protein